MCKTLILGLLLALLGAVAPSTDTPPDLVFADGFESGNTNEWVQSLIIRPSSVIFADSNWLPSEGSMPDAWQLIDETPANDADDFIRVVIGGQVNFELEDFPPGVVMALRIEWRYSTGLTGAEGNLTVALVEGEPPVSSRVIAQDTVIHATGAFADWTSRTFTVPDLTVIGNFNELALVLAYSDGPFLSPSEWRVTRAVARVEIRK